MEKKKTNFHTSLRTSESEADDINVIASPLVPNLPALPTCKYLMYNNQLESTEACDMFIYTIIHGSNQNTHIYHINKPNITCDTVHFQKKNYTR